MTDAPGKPAAAPPGQAAATDQSMEDILASIRRILNEDEAPTAAEAGTPDEPGPEAPAEAPAAGPPAEPPAEEPFLLTEDMMVSAPEDPPSVPAAAPPQPEPAAPAAATLLSDALLAPAAAAAAAASVGQLLRAVSAERGSAVTRGGPTIEDVVREELRPLLKAWLDQHLPPLVERLVRAEIERVVGRALS